MEPGTSVAGDVAQACTEIIHTVDETIGENRTYGTGIGPHDEDDQIAALVDEIENQDLFTGSIYTAKDDATAVRYPGGQFADLVIERGDQREYCEAKLFRFQKANENPSPQGFSKVFNPYQDKNPRSFIHDVTKLATSDIRATKSFLGIYYRPVNGAGTGITSEDIAEKFASDVAEWTDHTLTIDTIARFEGLQHPVHQRGAVITWTLADQPRQFF